MSSGRPALIVPYDRALETLGERVLIAGDASREAARAVSDAMPILERAGSVLVVSINPKSTPLGHEEVRDADIALMAPGFRHVAAPVPSRQRPSQQHQPKENRSLWRSVLVQQTRHNVSIEIFKHQRQMLPRTQFTINFEGHA